MKAKHLLILALSLIAFSACNNNSTPKADNETISITGRVTDFDGHPIDSCEVRLLYDKFQIAKVVFTNNEGYYTMEGVEKGRYLALYILKPGEYPREYKVPEDDMRLEFWAWNVIADRDLTVNARYHRLELYGTNVFKVEWSGAGYFIYTRPMSLQKALSYDKEIVLDKKKAEQVANISVKPEHFKVKVYADGTELNVVSVQPVEEYSGHPENPMIGYIIQVAKPDVELNKPYTLFRVEATNTEFNEKGENVFFYEVKDYKEAAE